jgi:GrpB-like predicted nucleotidyltransferase (UPF0157 family)
VPTPSHEPHPVDAPVHLEPYNPAWPQQYQIEAAAILDVIGPWVAGGIHHVGSTAVPGLQAKPVIDIMAGVADLDSSPPCIARLAALSYCYAPYRADTMHWFCKPSPAHRTHHLHLVPTGSDRFRGALAVRDHLRRHPGAACHRLRPGPGWRCGVRSRPSAAVPG